MGPADWRDDDLIALPSGSSNHVVDAGHRQYHSFFSDLWFGFDVEPHDDGLLVLAYARGRSWRGLWVSGGEVMIDFVVAVECLPVREECLVCISRRGKTNGPPWAFNAGPSSVSSKTSAAVSARLSTSSVGR